MATEENDLNSFLSGYRVITTATESTDLETANILKHIIITVQQKEVTPVLYFSRGIVPYLAPTENLNLYTDTLGVSPQLGISFEYANFFAGVTFLQSLDLYMAYDGDQLADAAHCTVGYVVGGANMYGAFKPLYDNYRLLQQYPYFYTLTAGNEPYITSTFGGVVEKGSSAGTYTLVNFGGTIAPFQLMFHPDTIGVTHSAGLPIGTGGNPLYFGLSANTSLNTAIKSLYFNPDMHFSLRRNLNLLRDRGIYFDAYLASFEPHYQFVKYSDNDFTDTLANIISLYNGNTANPAWTVELLRSAGTTSGVVNLNGFNTANDFNNRFFEEIKKYPRKYKTTAQEFNIGHYGIPYSTSMFGWSSQIPNPGVAVDGTGPYASVGSQYYLTRLAGLTLYPPPQTYNYGGNTSFGGSGGTSRWNSYKRAKALDSSYFPEYFKMGGTANAFLSGFTASNLVPANILKLFDDTSGPIGPLGTRMNFLDSYYYDLYQETLQYGGYRYVNFYPMEFTTRSNPLIPMQQKGSLSRNYQSRRDCTIHQDLGGNTAERLFNLKTSISDSIHSALKMWKLSLDAVGKFDYRIMPTISGRSEDLDLTRGGSVPYSAEDFVDYLVTPLFDGDVPANGFILKDDVNEYLLNGFYYGNLVRGANEYTNVITNSGASGTDKTTAFVRGMETYFFDLESTQHNMVGSMLSDFGLTLTAPHTSEYLNTTNSGRFSDYRVFETNTGITGGNTKIPYGFNGSFKWYGVPLRSSCIIARNLSLRTRWLSTTNDNINTAYEIFRDAYFALTKEQISATKAYFVSNDITTLVEYRATDKHVGR